MEEASAWHLGSVTESPSKALPIVWSPDSAAPTRRGSLADGPELDRSAFKLLIPLTTSLVLCGVYTCRYVLENGSSFDAITVQFFRYLGMCLLAAHTYVH